MRGERLAQERLRRGNTPIRSQDEIYAAPLLVHSSVQIVPFALDRDVRNDRSLLTAWNVPLHEKRLADRESVGCAPSSQMHRNRAVLLIGRSPARVEVWGQTLNASRAPRPVSSLLPSFHLGGSLHPHAV